MTHQTSRLESTGVAQVPDEQVSHVGVGTLSVHKKCPCVWLKSSMTGVSLVVIAHLCNVWNEEQRCP